MAWQVQMRGGCSRQLVYKKFLSSIYLLLACRPNLIPVVERMYDSDLHHPHGSSDQIPVALDPFTAHRREQRYWASCKSVHRDRVEVCFQISLFLSSI